MRTLVARLLLFAVIASLGAFTTACGGTTTTPSFDAAVNNTPDATVNNFDAASAADADTTPDAAVTFDAPPGGGESIELTDVTSAAGQVTGGGNTVEVQIGHWFGQNPATGGGNSIEGAAAIK